MKITCIGVGYVGLVAAACLADQGNEVIGVDVIQEKVDKLNNGKVPIYEPGLQEILDRNLKDKRIQFTTNMKAAVEHAQVIFICVGTPPDENNRADLKYVMQAAESIGKHMTDYVVVVDKSTVPVGTAHKVAEKISQSQPSPIEFDVVSNPEFLREGEAIGDFTQPDRILVGTDSDRARQIMEKIYKGIARVDHPLLFTDVKSAEVIKYASNALLATKISFMNELSHLCEKVNADVKEVARGMGWDKRIGSRFLQAGVGYGGSCFPKDVQALIHTMEDEGCDAPILKAVEHVNHIQKESLLPKITDLVGDLTGKTIAVWGLAFKPKTDDMREAPSIVVINQLQQAGASIKAFDPVAMENAKKLFDNIEYCETPYSTVEGADALVILTEWNEFRNLEKKKLKALLKEPIIIDGRNIYDPKDMEELGFSYRGIGR